MRQLAGVELIKAGVPAVEVRARLNDLNDVLGGAPGFMPQPPQGGKEPPMGPPPGGGLPPMDAAAAMRRVNPRLMSELEDAAKPGRIAPGYADSPDKFFERVYGLDEGATLKQNWPTIQAYAQSQFSPEQLATVASPPLWMSKAEQYNAAYNPLMNVLTLGANVLGGENPLSPKTQAANARSVAGQVRVPLAERARQALGVPSPTDRRNALIRALMSGGGTR
jgi:hypothetical protein